MPQDEAAEAEAMAVEATAVVVVSMAAAVLISVVVARISAAVVRTLEEAADILAASTVARAILVASTVALRISQEAVGISVAELPAESTPEPRSHVEPAAAASATVTPHSITTWAAV